MAPVDLTAAKAYSKELAPGKTDLYTIELAVGDYLEIEVRPREFNLQLSQEEGPKPEPGLIEVPTGGGARKDMYLSPSTGKYSLAVMAPAIASGERYEVKVAALRQPTDEDHARLQASEATFDGEKALKDGALTSLRHALEEFQQALALWRQTKEPYGVMAALSDLGRTYATLGEYRQAIEYFTQAVRHSDSLEEPRTMAAALAELSEAYYNSAEYSKTIEFHSQALSIWRQLGDGTHEATTLIRLGAAHRELGDTQEAVDQLGRALEITKRLADKSSEAAALNQLGLLYLSLGQTEKAIECLKESLPLIRAIGFERGEAYALNNLADAYSKLNQNAVARDYLVQSQPKMVAAKDRWGQALVFTNMAEIEGRIGDLTQAQEHMMAALTLRREVGDVRGEGYALLNLGDLKARLGDYQGAVDYLGQAAALRESIHDWNGQATALYRIARLEFSHGELDQSRNRMDQVIQLAERFRLGVVNEALRSSYFASVQEYYEFAALLLMRLDRADPSKGYAALAFEISERARARTLVDALSGIKIDAPTEADQKLFEQEKELEAEIGAKTQAQTKLSGAQRSGEDGLWGSEIDALLDRYYQLQAKIRASNPRFSETVNPQPLKLAEIQRQLLDDDTTLVEFMLGAEHSYAWCVTRGSMTTAELAPRADIESAAIELHERLSNNKPYEQAAEKVAGLILLPIAPYLRSKRLVIVSAGVLQYLPFSALPLPSATRPEGVTVPLITEYEVISAPSASALATIRETTKSKVQPGRSVAVLADPVFERSDVRFGRRPAISSSGGNVSPATELQDLRRGLRDTGRSSFARLVFTRAEARAIADSVGRGNVKTALDFEASREAATSFDLSNYEVVHFATHGILDNEHPELSGVVLSLFNEKGEPRDGFLRLYEIYALKLPVRLVVLSACDTGLGKDVKGEGIISLTRGFMYAGAERVVVTAWAVHDQATSELMARFYRAMFHDHLPPAAALRSAQLDLAKDQRWRSPYYWAGFMVQGDWR